MATKTKWKTVILRLPREVDKTLHEIARRSGDPAQVVARVIITMQLMRLQAIGASRKAQ